MGHLNIELDMIYVLRRVRNDNVLVCLALILRDHHPNSTKTSLTRILSLICKRMMQGEIRLNCFLLISDSVHVYWSFISHFLYIPANLTDYKVYVCVGLLLPKRFEFTFIVLLDHSHIDKVIHVVKMLL